MNRAKKILKSAFPAVIAAVCIVCSVVFIAFQNPFVPENPLDSKTDASHMLISSGKGLNVSDDVLSQNENSVNKTDSSKSEEMSSASESEASSDESAESHDEKAAEQPKNTDTEYEPVIYQGVNKHNSSSQKPSEKQNDSKKELNSGDKDDIKKSGEKQKPADQKTDTEYFSVTIKDGETVNSRDYSFEIIHKNPNLTVRSETVSVNGVKQVQFHGNVLLEEGKNTIRVAVKYTDKSGKAVSVYKDYTVFVSIPKAKLRIDTDLSDRETDSDSISFSACAYLGEQTVNVEVKCNGEIITSDDNNNYTVSLKSGENVIALSAQADSQSVSREYKIQCNASKGFDIYTDLEDMTVHTDSIDFTAYMLNGTAQGRLTVVVNGRTLRADGNEYTAPLKIGSNVIRFKATDKIDGKKVTIDRSYNIKYVPAATEETAPRLEYINLTDGMTVRGNEFTLDLQPVDYLGNRIFYNGITVQLNGVTYLYRWASEYTSYLLWFQNGNNKLDVRITDTDGRYTDYSYAINCFVPGTGAKIGEITMSIDANVLGIGNIIPPTTVDIYQGEGAAEMLCRFLEENGFEYRYSGELNKGFYLSRISKQGLAAGVNIPQQLIDEINADGLEWKEQRFADSLGEFDYCQGSGWMYSINGSFTNYGFSDAVLKDGDVVRVRYTLAYGKDIGGFDATGGAGKNYDITW